jgi:hypothetical protein
VRPTVADIVRIALERLRADMKAADCYADARGRKIARVTLAAFGHNLALELVAAGLSDSEVRELAELEP